MKYLKKFNENSQSEEIDMIKDFFISLNNGGDRTGSSIYDTKGVGGAEKRDIENLDEYTIHIVGYENMSNLIKLFNNIEDYHLDDEDDSGEQGKDENYWFTIYKTN
jgi:hypothetical protein